jgi:hypothetical protein
MVIQDLEGEYYYIRFQGWYPSFYNGADNSITSPILISEKAKFSSRDANCASLISLIQNDFMKLDFQDILTHKENK